MKNSKIEHRVTHDKLTACRFNGKPLPVLPADTYYRYYSITAIAGSRSFVGSPENRLNSTLAAPQVSNLLMLFFQDKNAA
ncbi:MAG: hypothetical protein HYV28_15295 [Ignavibacteriales bacterium]|nr:hypothetical protein [Ignavibacteriales bacterium]